jgi:hypothetical protein
MAVHTRDHNQCNFGYSEAILMIPAGFEFQNSQDPQLTAAAVGRVAYFIAGGLPPGE